MTPEEFCKSEETIDGKTILLCPNPECNDSGGFPVGDHQGGWEECQCEFCYTVDNSKFNYTQELKAKENPNE